MSMNEARLPHPKASDLLIPIEIIHDVRPLDGQFGVHPRLTVPASIRNALFGEPDPTELELSWVDGDASRLASMRTFAVLDATKISSLDVRLEASGLEHCCLFSGKAFEEYSNVAPWLVELKLEAQLTRQIFTRNANSASALWERVPGFFLQARVPLATMRQHLRKFTRVRDERGQWYYFRFWEAAYARLHLARIASDNARAAHWFSLDQTERASVLVLDRSDASMTIFSGRSLPNGRPNTTYSLAAEDRRAFKSMRADQFTTRLDAHLRNKRASFDRLTPEDRNIWLHAMISEARQNDLRLEKSVADYAEAYVLLGRSPAADASIARHLNNARHELDRARSVLDEARNRTLVRRQFDR